MMLQVDGQRSPHRPRRRGSGRRGGDVSARRHPARHRPAEAERLRRGPPHPEPARRQAHGARGPDRLGPGRGPPPLRTKRASTTTSSSRWTRRRSKPCWPVCGRYPDCTTSASPPRKRGEEAGISRSTPPAYAGGSPAAWKLFLDAAFAPTCGAGCAPHATFLAPHLSASRSAAPAAHANLPRRRKTPSLQPRGRRTHFVRTVIVAPAGGMTIPTPDQYESRRRGWERFQTW